MTIGPILPSTGPPIGSNDTVQTSDNKAVYNDLGTSNTASITTDYMAYNTYEWDNHKFMGGVTSPNGFQGKSVVFYQLCNPTLLWICRWTACKFNEQPEVPDPNSVNATNWTLLDILPELPMIGVSPDGVTPIYRVSGTYIYGHNNPDPNPFNNVTFPRASYIEDVFTRTIPLSKLLDNLIDVTGGSSSPNPFFPGGGFTTPVPGGTKPIGG